MKYARRSVIVMVLFAVILLAMGLYIFSQAPVSAHARTALIIPGACAALMLLMAALTWAGIQDPRRAKLAKIGGHLGMVLPFVFAVLFMMPATARAKALAKYPETLSQYEAATAQGTAPTDPAQRRQWFKDKGSSDHDISYLVKGLWTLKGLSWTFGIVLLVLGLKSRKEALAARAAEPSRGTPA
jgi:hypothetical protein